MLVDEKLKQLRTRYISITAPLTDITNKLTIQGFFHWKKKAPQSNVYLIINSDVDIIKTYSQIIQGLINYYRAADNFSSVKGVAEALRRSCALTLSRKHKKSLA